MPGRLGVPYSMRYGYSSRWVRCALRTPVPPARVRRISTSSRTYMPPIPIGPSSDLWPVKQRTATPRSSMSSGSTPAVCEASRISGMPRSRQWRPTSRTACTVPITFEPWFMTTAFVSGRRRAMTAAGSTWPRSSKSTQSTSAPCSCSAHNGRSVELCSACVVTAWSPGRNRPEMARFSMSVAL